MTGQPPNQTPAWSSGGVPPSVKKPPAKRSRPPARRPPPSLTQKKFIPPKDLTAYLAKINPIPINPLNRPKSSVLYGVRIKYGDLFPYYSQALLDAIKPLTCSAGYIDIRPYKGYIDVGFESQEQANNAAAMSITFNSTPLPIFLTRHFSQALTVIKFIGLPTHLPYKVLCQELYDGLSQYGSNPELIFDTPQGITGLAGPTASAVVDLYTHISPSNIPPTTVVPSAPEHIIRCSFDGKRQTCLQCKQVAHKGKDCTPLISEAHLVDTQAFPCPNPMAPIWGSLLQVPAQIPLASHTPLSTQPPQEAWINHPLGQLDGRLSTCPSDRSNQLVDRSNNLNSQSTNQAMDKSTNHRMEINPQPHIQSKGASNKTTNNAHGTTSNPPISCTLPPVEYETGNPFSMLRYFKKLDDNTEIPIELISPSEWFEMDVNNTNFLFRPANQFKHYTNTHQIATKIKNISIPQNFIDTLSKAAISISQNAPRLAIPTRTPPELMDALEATMEATKQSVSELAAATSQVIESRISQPHRRSTTALVNLRLETEEALTILAKTLYSYDSLVDGSTIMSMLSPHLADYPTPWLSAFERLPEDNNPGLEPPADPDPMD